MKLKHFLILALLLAVIPLLDAQTDKPPIRRLNQPRHPLGFTNGAAMTPATTTAPAAAGVTPPSIPGTPATFPGGAGNDPANPTGAAAGANAGPGKPPEATFKYNFPAMPIQQVLDEYAKLVGKTLLMAKTGPGAVPDTTTITLNTPPLNHDDAVMVLETILGMNGVTMVSINDKFLKVVPDGAVASAGGLISTNDASHIPDAGKVVTQIVQLKYAKPEELTAVLQLFAKMPSSIIVVPSTSTLILRDYAENVKRMLEMVERIDIQVPNEIKHEVIPIKYALASDISSALSSLGGGTSISVGKSTSGAGFSRGGSGGTGLVGGVGGSGSTGSYNNGSNPINPGQPTQSGNPLSSAAGGARSSFQNNLQRIVNKASGGGAAGDIQLFGVTKIIADERTNSLLIFANEEDMKMIKDIIDKLDVVLAQVLIEAIILEVSLTDSRDVGLSYLSGEKGFGNGVAGAGGLNNLTSGASGFITGTSTTTTSSDGSTNSTTTGTPGGVLSSPGLANLPGGFSYFTRFNKDLNVVLTAVAGNSRVNVLSRPRIQTSHAVSADLFIGQTVPYVTGTYFGGGLNGSGPSSQYQEKEVGIRLQVLPLINSEGLVVMDIQQDIEQLGPSVAIPGAGNVPTTTKRQAGAKVAVRDGETIILGGFISASRSKSHSGIPWLKDIPGLGALFRSNSEDNERTELIVLMRPTVLRTPEIAAIVAREERNKMSGVKQAERDLREDERKRNESIDKQLEKDEARQKADDEKKAKKEQKKLEKAAAKSAPTTTVVVPAPAAVSVTVDPAIVDPTEREKAHLKAVLVTPQP